ncbi:MAG: ribulose-phosphate 3-epimerase [Anaerolineae bacterium]|nr:ribulose-phosphate 3-epimerase [Anaerolineae bacterium]
MLKIAASILSADFCRLGEQIAAAERAGADYIHCDVMDGHFVPNITIGPMIVGAVRRATSLPLDVHLMIEGPERYIPHFARAGASSLTVHVETCPHLHRTVQQIKELALSAGVAINPATPLNVLEEILPYVDVVLVMTVNPGFGGQSFIETMCRKIERLGEWIRRERLCIDLEVDGGINVQTAGRVVRAGANVLVAGSAIFAPEGEFTTSGGIADALHGLRQAAVGEAEPGSEQSLAGGINGR